MHESVTNAAFKRRNREGTVQNRIHKFFWRACTRAARNSAGKCRLLILPIAMAAVIDAQSPVAAQPFTTITGFGDSYADTGTAPGGAFPRLLFPCPPGPPTNPTCHFSQGTNFVDTLQSIYNLPPLTNYAV